MRDRSLDEFATGETAADEREEENEEATENEPEAAATTDDESSEAGTDAETADSEAAAEPSERAVEPALSTYDWTPGGADCGRCGETVEKRWRDGDGTGEAMVCADCKEW
jgi:hypothetical protein